MPYGKWGVFGSALLLLSLATGCSQSSSRTNSQPDPLLVANKPVETSPTTSPTEPRDQARPAAPGRPNGPWMLALHPRARLQKPLVADTNNLTSPYSWTVKKMIEEPGDSFSHAENYKWLQGYLERSSAECLLLRFTDSADEDIWGGKVCLEKHPHLETFLDGDLIYVEGEIVRKDGRVVFGEWSTFPLYRLKHLILVRRSGD